MSNLVTGEAVVLELRIARLASRALAELIDIGVQLVALVLGLVAISGLVAFLDDAAGAALGLLWAVAVLVIWPVTFETLSRGRSLGKLALGLRVVRDDGGPVRFRQSLVRALTAVFPDIWLSSGSVALIVSLASPQAKRLGDYAAETIVVLERVPSARGSAVVMPPALAAWAQDLSLAGLPDDLALAGRQFLTRADDFDPAAARHVSERLANAVSVHAGPPPPGVPAWAYLSAVLAERTRRETARLTGASRTAPRTPAYAPPPPAYAPLPPGYAPPAAGYGPPPPGYAPPAQGYAPPAPSTPAQPDAAYGPGPALALPDPTAQAPAAPRSRSSSEGAPPGGDFAPPS